MTIRVACILLAIASLSKSATIQSSVSCRLTGFIEEVFVESKSTCSIARDDNPMVAADAGAGATSAPEYQTAGAFSSSAAYRFRDRSEVAIASSRAEVTYLGKVQSAHTPGFLRFHAITEVDGYWLGRAEVSFLYNGVEYGWYQHEELTFPVMLGHTVAYSIRTGTSSWAGDGGSGGRAERVLLVRG